MSGFDREHAHGFLSFVYGGLPGWLQIVDSGRNFFGQAFATDEAGINAAADYAAQRDTTSPAGIYFRATTMNTRDPKKADGSLGRGGADITVAVPMLWADIDYGDAGHKRPPVNPVTGKEQLPNPPTEADARGLVADAGLPEPTMWVHSGGGLYPLWMLAEEVGVDQAALLSEGIQEAIERASAAHGWHYGTGVKDLARVLRLPGSINRKTDTDRPCRGIDYNPHTIPAAALPLPVPKEPKKAPVSNTAPRDPNHQAGAGGSGAFDTLAETTTWAEILEPAGWSFVATESNGWERWLRPGGADSEYSARAFEHNLVCHSESAGLPSGSGQRLTKGRVYAWLWYDGDLSAAARALLQGENRGGLPVSTMDAIQEAHPLMGYANAHDFLMGVKTPTGGMSLGVASSATTEELEYFLATYTRYRSPDRLGRRMAWMKLDRPNRLGFHAHHLIEDVMAGHFPADRALAALSTAYRAHGGQDPDGARALLSAALGAVLGAAVSA